MKILHLPHNVCGIPAQISSAFRSIGYKSDVMQFYDSVFDQAGADVTLFESKVEQPYKRHLKLVSYFCKALYYYDIFQFHTRATFFDKGLDTKIFKLLRKKYYIYHHGSDVIGNNNYLKHVPHSKNAKAIFISTPDLYSYVPHSAILVRQAISIEYLNRFRKRKSFYDHTKSPIVITHAIASKKVYRSKGTDIIVDAISILKKKGFNIDFRFFIGHEHELLVEQISTSDLHIDQMCIGWYGTISAEAMALGVPTVCYIKSSLKKYLMGCPIIEANKLNLVKTIEETILNVELRKKLSKKSIEFACSTHSKESIANNMLKIYQDT